MLERFNYPDENMVAFFVNPRMRGERLTGLPDLAAQRSGGITSVTPAE